MCHLSSYSTHLILHYFCLCIHPRHPDLPDSIPCRECVANLRATTSSCDSSDHFFPQSFVFVSLTNNFIHIVTHMSYILSKSLCWAWSRWPPWESLRGWIQSLALQSRFPGMVIRQVIKGICKPVGLWDFQVILTWRQVWGGLPDDYTFASPLCWRPSCCRDLREFCIDINKLLHREIT